MRKLLSFVACLMACQMIMAAPVTKSQALSAATAFMKEKGWNVKQQPRMAPRKAKAQAAEKNYVYLFNSDNGFVIVSGDDQTEPILGYVEGAQFNEDEMPENMKWWIGEYERQIKYLQDHNIQQVQYVLDAPAVSPLIESDWDQDEPYNNSCPTTSSGQKTVTGCLATALAQVMFFHKWPQEATTAIPSYRTQTNRIQMAQLPATTFDWANMKNNYYSSNATQKAAVAKLMLYCGQANYMDYCTAEQGGSGASEVFVPNALVNYFGYNESVQDMYRDCFSVREWDEMIYFELANNRPVFYAGQSTGGGHAFVCDGYDGNGLFHIAWGWGMNSYLQSWCRLSVLNPYTTAAIGASSTEDGFSFGQSAIIGVQSTEATGEVRPLGVQNDMSYTEINGNIIYLAIANMSAVTKSFEVALAIEGENGELQIISTQTNQFQPSYQTWNMDWSTHQLSASMFGGNGTYKLGVYSRVAGTTKWMPAQNNAIDYFVATVNGNKLTLGKHERLDANLTVESMGFKGSIKKGTVAEFTADVKNAGTDEYSGEVYLFQSTKQSKGSAVSIAGAYIEPGTTETLSFYFAPTATEDLNIWLCTDENGQNVIGQMTVGATEKDAYTLAIESSSVVTDPLKISVKIKNSSPTTYNRPVVATIYRADTNQPLMRKVSKTQEIAAGETAEYVYTSLPGTDTQYDYYLILSYYPDSKTTETEAFDTRIDVKFTQPSGIAPVSADNGEAKWFTTSGVRISAPTKKGIYIRNGKKVVVK